MGAAPLSRACATTTRCWRAAGRAKRRLPHSTQRCNAIATVAASAGPGLRMLGATLDELHAGGASWRPSHARRSWRVRRTQEGGRSHRQRSRRSRSRSPSQIPTAAPRGCASTRPRSSAASTTGASVRSTNDRAERGRRGYPRAGGALGLRIGGVCRSCRTSPPISPRSRRGSREGGSSEFASGRSRCCGRCSRRSRRRKAERFAKFGASASELRSDSTAGYGSCSI